MAIHGPPQSCASRRCWSPKPAPAETAAPAPLFRLRLLDASGRRLLQPLLLRSFWLGCSLLRLSHRQRWLRAWGKSEVYLPRRLAHPPVPPGRRVLEPTLGLAGPAGTVALWGSGEGSRLAQRWSLGWLRLPPPLLRLLPGGGGCWDCALVLGGLNQRLPQQRPGGRPSASLWNGSPLAAAALARVRQPLPPPVAALVAGLHWGDGSLSTSGARVTFSVAAELRSLPLLWWLRRQLGGGNIYLARSRRLWGPPTAGSSFGYVLRSRALLVRLVRALGPLVYHGPKRQQLEKAAAALGVALAPPQPLAPAAAELLALGLFYSDGSVYATRSTAAGSVGFRLTFSQANPAAVELLQSLWGGQISSGAVLGNDSPLGPRIG